VITLLDQDIAHIARIMRPPLHEDRGGPVLPAEYWRGRLHRLLNASHLTKNQLCAIDELLLQLDRFVEGPSDGAADAVTDRKFKPNESVQHIAS
jgi:hypothetical protein